MSPPRLTLAFLGDPDSVHTRRWLGFFAERGHAVHLFVSAGEPRTPGLPEAIQLEAYPGYGRHLRPRGGLAATRSLRRRLRDLRPDVLHAHYVTRYGWLGRLSGYHPFVVTAWGSDVFRIGSTSPVARWLTRHALTSADLVTVVSDELGRAAVATGARPAVVRRVQFGVDGSRFLPGPAPAALRDRLGLEGCRVVFAPRAIRPVYRQATVVEALPTLPPDVVVVLSALGSDPATLDDLLRLAEHLGVADRLRLVEAMPHPEMADYYRLADVVVSVPETDAFPVTALEAMASGKPLVLSDLASAREGLAGVAAEGVQAVRTVPVGDPTATGAAILELLALDPAAAAAAAGALRAAALERGEVSRSLLRMEAYYQALAERREPGP